MQKLEYIYKWPNLAPAAVHRMDDSFGWTFNQLTYAISDVKKDIQRLDEEFGDMK